MSWHSIFFQSSFVYHVMPPWARVLSHPPICFLSLAQSSRSVKRKTCRSFLAPSTNSTMKLSFSSCRFWAHNKTYSLQCSILSEAKIHHVSKKKKGMFIRHTSDRFYSSVVKKTLLALVFEWHTAIKIHYSLLWFIMMHYECIIWLTMVDIVLMNSFQRNRKFQILHQLSRQSASKAAGSETTIWFTIWNIMINYEYIRRFLLICYNP